MVYAFIVISLSIYLIYVVVPQHGQSNILVYIAICSLIGSLTVMACKGLSIAIRLTLTGDSQLKNPLGWFFLIAVASCITVQMNYLNRSLDTFNTSLVTPIYYVMFTTMTMNPAWLHLDFDYAAQSEFGRPLVNSMLTVAIVVGISVHETTLGTTVANLGCCWTLSSAADTWMIGFFSFATASCWRRAWI